MSYDSNEFERQRNMTHYETKLEEFDTYEDVFGGDRTPKYLNKTCRVHLVFHTDIEMEYDKVIRNSDIIKEEMVEYGICDTDTEFTFEVQKGDDYVVVINILSK